MTPELSLLRKAIFLACGLIIASSEYCFAGEVARVTLDQKSIAIFHDNPNDPYQLGENICVIHHGQEAACGHIIKTTSKGAIVAIDERHELISEGDAVEDKGSRKPANDTWNDDEEETEQAIPTKKETEEEYKTRIKNMDRLEVVDFHRDVIHRRGENYLVDNTVSLQDKLKRNYNLSFGTQVFGMTYGNCVWPELYFQYALSKSYAVGVSANYFGYSVSGVTAELLGVNAYIEFFPMETLNGVFSRIGAGMSEAWYTSPSADGTQTFAGNSLAYQVIGELGWRWIIGKSFNISLSAGALFTTMPVGPSDGTTGIEHASVVIPLGTAQFGFTF